MLSELIGRHAGELEEYRSKIQAVVRALLPLEPEHLEMIATVDYAFRQLKASGGPRPTKKAVIERFVQIKGDKFPLTTLGRPTTNSRKQSYSINKLDRDSLTLHSAQFRRHFLGI